MRDQEIGEVSGRKVSMAYLCEQVGEEMLSLVVCLCCQCQVALGDQRLCQFIVLLIHPVVPQQLESRRYHASAWTQTHGRRAAAHHIRK